MLVLYAVLLFIFIYIIVQHLRKIRNYVVWIRQIKKLPTVKGKQFLLGHLGMLLNGSYDNSWKVIRKILDTGHPFSTFFIGPDFLGQVYVMVLEPEEIETFISPMENLKKAPEYIFFREWLEDGLLTNEGREQWRTRRKMLTPAFHFSILRKFVDTFIHETSSLVQEIENQYLDKPVDITPLISTYTLLSITDTCMGTRLDIKSREGQQYKKALYGMAELLFYRATRPWLHFKYIYNITADGRLSSKMVKAMHRFTNKLIQKRAENFEVFEDLSEDSKNYNSKRKYPFLDIMLNAKFKNNSIDEKGIREEVNTFVFEGHDTTAMSLSFTCMLLAAHSEIQTEIYQEIVNILGTDPARKPSYDDLQNMPLLDRCIKESLRLYPPVELIGRQTGINVLTKYGVVPKGTTILIDFYSLHRNKKYWTNPDIFDPSRHTLENSTGRHPYAYLPFSAGPRNCIGQRFAMLEMKTLICGLVRKFILEPVDPLDKLELIQDVVIRPKNGIKLKFVLRKEKIHI